MIEVDLYTLAKEAPEHFEDMWAEMRRELNVSEEHREIFKTVYCHGYCKALNGIVEMIERETIKPQAVC